MGRSYRYLAAAVLFSLLAPYSASTPADQDGKLDPALQRKVISQYPGQRLVNSCDGAFLRRHGDAVVALYDAANKRVTVAWVTRRGEMQKLDSVPAPGESKDFELKCMNPKQVRELKETLRSSETIEDFLRIPASAGAVCYFTDQTTTKCWSLDAKSGKLEEAGGWQT